MKTSPQFIQVEFSDSGARFIRILQHGAPDFRPKAHRPALPMRTLTIFIFLWLTFFACILRAALADRLLWDATEETLKTAEGAAITFACLTVFAVVLSVLEGKRGHK